LTIEILPFFGNRKRHRDPPGKKYRFVRLVCFGEEEEKALKIICKGGLFWRRRGKGVKDYL